jgi:catechol 2,3-dioxygenase-like lactoylglutathione lyase family enzyme
MKTTDIGVAVSDPDAAVVWYERLLGEPPTFVAHDTEVVWTVAEPRSIYVLLRPERAGQAMVTLYTRETYGNGVRKVIYENPDGNEIGFGGGPVEEDDGR